MSDDKKFPTEVIDLPSKGWYYDPKSPLSSGQIELKYLTAKEEDILTSTNLIQKGLVIDKLLQSLIVDKSIDYNDLLIGDKNAILIAARVLGYGKTYDSTVACTTCGNRDKLSFDLTLLEEKKVSEPKEKGVNSFQFKLPLSGRVLTFKLLTQTDEMSVNEVLLGLQKAEGDEEEAVDHTLTTRLKHIITAVDGDSKQSTIWSFVDDEFLARDSRAFRMHYQEITPDIDLFVDHKCSKCKNERRVAVPIGIDFFWPDTGV